MKLTTSKPTVETFSLSLADSRCLLPTSNVPFHSLTSNLICPPWRVREAHNADFKTTSFFLGGCRHPLAGLHVGNTRHTTLNSSPLVMEWLQLTPFPCQGPDWMEAPPTPSRPPARPLPGPVSDPLIGWEGWELGVM
ncbi:hypothetical protein ACOMHN_016606 [Nucella lapillus]